jgi:hypothetical protein
MTVDSQTSTGVLAYEDALKAYKAANCAAACPAILCRGGPSGVCNSTNPAAPVCAQ